MPFLRAAPEPCGRHPSCRFPLPPPWWVWPPVGPRHATAACDATVPKAYQARQLVTMLELQCSDTMYQIHTPDPPTLTRSCIPWPAFELVIPKVSRSPATWKRAGGPRVTRPPHARARHACHASRPLVAWNIVVPLMEIKIHRLRGDATPIPSEEWRRGGAAAHSLGDLILQAARSVAAWQRVSPH